VSARRKNVFLTLTPGTLRPLLGQGRLRGQAVGQPEQVPTTLKKVKKTD
jgi:hypothetical protein